MELGTWAGLITAFATVLTATGGLIATLKVLIPNYQQTKEVHQIVNQQRTDMEQYTKALTAALTEHGIDIPADQSKIK